MCCSDTSLGYENREAYTLAKIGRRVGKNGRQLRKADIHVKSALRILVRINARDKLRLRVRCY